jgi:hypothetical protein
VHVQLTFARKKGAFYCRLNTLRGNPATILQLGCQIFLIKCTKKGENIPNYH